LSATLARIVRGPDAEKAGGVVQIERISQPGRNVGGRRVRGPGYLGAPAVDHAEGHLTALVD
jgi:hypothetical protein